MTKIKKNVKTFFYIYDLNDRPSLQMSGQLSICVNEANLQRHARHDTDRTVLSCLAWRCELSRLDRHTGAFCVGVCRAARCDRWTHSDAERTCWTVGSTQFTPPDMTQTGLSCRVWRAVWTGQSQYTSQHIDGPHWRSTVTADSVGECHGIVE